VSEIQVGPKAMSRGPGIIVLLLWIRTRVITGSAVPLAFIIFSDGQS